jgi:hypothetical protein
LQLSGEEVLPKLKVGLDPIECDEGQDMISLVGIQMLKLNPIMVKEHVEELVGGCQHAFVEVHCHTQFSEENQALIICVPRKSTHTTTK